jgi:hypothetical protein
MNTPTEEAVQRAPRMSFEYDPSELPPVREDIAFHLPNGERIRYFYAKDWSFSNLTDEDANIDRVREAVLAHIAWYEFLLTNPDIPKSRDAEPLHLPQP